MYRRDTRVSSERLRTVVYTYVRTTAPFAFAQASKIWSSDALRRLAAALTGLSTGPPGNCVTGLEAAESISESRQVSKDGQDIHQGTVRLIYDAFLVEIVEERRLSLVRIWVEDDLYSRRDISTFCNMQKYVMLTWFTAGTILAEANRVSMCSISKLLIPILLWAMMPH